MHFLCLRPYAKSIPERFFDRNVHDLALNWLRNRDSGQQKPLQEYFESAAVELSQAMFFLRRINSEDWVDRLIDSVDSYASIHYIDQQLHPAYLRLVEGVLAPFARLIAHFTRLDRRKGTAGLEIFTIAQELSATAMAPCIAGYVQTVRNAIGHGGITYKQSEIVYKDKSGSELTLPISEAVRLCDDLLDVCNGLASALKLFLIISRNLGYHLPRELLIEELVEETRTPWWSIEGCVESVLKSGKQLTVYARPNSRDSTKIQFSSMQSAVMAEMFAPGYGRYFFSLQTPKAPSGWAAFNGEELRRQRMSGAKEIAQYATAFEEVGFFYFPKHPLPRFLGKMETLLHIFRLNSPIFVEQMRLLRSFPKLVCRNARTHRNAWGLVLSGNIVLTEATDGRIVQTIRTFKRRIIRTAAKQARLGTAWYRANRYLPLGYARISVFSRDFRRRRLNDYGLGPALICTIQLKRIRSIKSPDIYESTVENDGNWRIAGTKPGSSPLVLHCESNTEPGTG